MSKIFYESQVLWEGKKSSPGIGTLLDTGSGSCYVDIDIIESLGWKTGKQSYVGLGTLRKRYEIKPDPTFIIKFKRKKYKGKAKTYATSLSGFGVLISGNLIRKMKLPAHKVKEYVDFFEF